jgi:hypothetical protein
MHPKWSLHVSLHNTEILWSEKLHSSPKSSPCTPPRIQICVASVVFTRNSRFHLVDIYDCANTYFSNAAWLRTPDRLWVIHIFIRYSDMSVSGLCCNTERRCSGHIIYLGRCDRKAVIRINFVLAGCLILLVVNLCFGSNYNWKFGNSCLQILFTSAFSVTSAVILLLRLLHVLVTVNCTSTGTYANCTTSTSTFSKVKQPVINYRCYKKSEYCSVLISKVSY